MYQQHKAVNICIYKPKMIVRQYRNLHVFHAATSSTWLRYYHRCSLILYLWVLFCICLRGHVSWQGHTQHGVWFIGIHRWRSCIGTFCEIYKHSSRSSTLPIQCNGWRRKEITISISYHYSVFCFQRYCTGLIRTGSSFALHTDTISTWYIQNT